MKSLNLVMIVKNEERCLSHCLNQVKHLVDHIIIVDTGSTDSTKEIALSYGAQLYHYNWNGDFSAARNYALDQSDADWNLILDADEYLIQGTRSDLADFLKNPKQLGAIQLNNAYQDHDEISYGISVTTRLLPRGVRFSGKIHEQADSPLPRIPLPLIFDHDGYLMPNKAERNLPILLDELQKDPNDAYVLFQTGTTLRNMNRFKEACNYFKKFYTYATPHMNYRNRGVIAYLYTLMEISDYETALNLITNEQNSLSSNTDFLFACGIFYMKLVLSNTSKYISYLPRIEASYLKCLEIGEIPEHQGVLGTGSFKAAYNLGVWYEVSGDMVKAKQYYQEAARQGYPLAKKRLETLK